MIAKTRHGNVVIERREASLGSLLRAEGLLRGGTTASVTARDVAGLPAWRQAIRVAAEAVAKHPMCVWRGEDAERRRVTTTWQARFFAGEPNELYPWFYVWECTEASLTARNNAYWLKEHDELGRVRAIYVVHPDSVLAQWSYERQRAEYRVTLADGRQSEWLTTREVLHFRNGSVLPGAVVAPSPIQEYRRSWATALARLNAEASYYEGGNMKTTAVVFGGDVQPEQAERWRQVYLGPGGVTSGSQVKVFGGDPRIETIGLSLADQQFVESQAFGIDDVGRILGVPPSLLWAASSASSKPITPEHEEDRWTRYGLEPRRQRIEHCVAHDRSFFGPGARDYPGWHVRRVRGDALTESDMIVHEVQAGIRTPNEGRVELGLPPHRDGDILQITPVGGGPNPDLTSQVGTSQDDEDSD